MSIIVSAYTKNAFKEFFLPSMNNSDYSITFNKNDFSMQNDFSVKLEVLDNNWSFVKSSDYYIEMDGRIHFGKILRNGDVLRLITKDNYVITLLIFDVAKPFDAFDKYNINGIGRITIGSSPSSMLQYNTFGLVSKKHAEIYRENDSWHLKNYGDNGTFVGSARISSDVELRFGDCINIFGLRIVFYDSMIAVKSSGEIYSVNSGVLRPVDAGSGVRTGLPPNEKRTEFSRSPRKIEKIYTDPVEVDSPPQPQQEKKRPLLLTIGPSLTMAIPMVLGCLLAVFAAQGGSSAFMFTGVITAVSAGIFGVFWAMMNMKYEKNAAIEQEQYRLGRYSEYLDKCAESIKQKYIANARAMSNMYLSAAECCRYDEKNPNLWNRNYTHDDFLFVRLGLGAVDFQVPIIIQKQKFTLIEDTLADRPGEIKTAFRKLKNVPVGIDLGKKRMFGIVGSKNHGAAYSIVRCIAANIAANNCYTDVKMIFIYDEARSGENWSYTKWLPHVWSEDRKVRFIGANKNDIGDIFFELSNTLRTRAESIESGGTQKVQMRPRYILFVEDISLIEGELISKYIFDTNTDYGITTVVMAETRDELPNSCEDIVECSEDFSGIYNVYDSFDERRTVKFDQISVAETEKFARRISGIRVKELESGGELPSSLTFLEMYNVNKPEELNVYDRWRKNRTYETMKTLVGRKSGGADCYLDIHEKYHGPHGLVAGTTGSGKSETLQSYILSLSIDFSPDDVGFFIIDFKGGGMANLFSDLPHLVGQISNLSGNQVHRAMVSIKSENKRRQKIFSEHGVNNINSYTRLVKNNEASLPVPHLFIIIDEFAELKREEPDFMRELISVAQIGRSLGVHLILATQKPSGTVDDNIWSNAKFRLCLRVQDKQDSNDMLHKPDAAYITQAGRCYLQVGNDEIFELFQSGYSGAAYDAAGESQRAAIAKMLTLTGREAVVGSRSMIKRKNSLRLRWITGIVECILDASKSSGISILDAQTNVILMNKLLTKVYDKLHENDIKYSSSKADRDKIMNLINLWTEEILYMGLAPEEQSAFLVDEAAAARVQLPEVKEASQLEAVIEYLKNVAKYNGYDHGLKLWLPILPEMIYLNELDGYSGQIFNGKEWIRRSGEWRLEAYIGKYDDPVNQAQQPLMVSFTENGHYAVCGTVVSGKSTFLQSLIYSLAVSYTPDYVNMYAIDFSSRLLSVFEELPHMGGVMYEGDLEKIGKFFNMVKKMLSLRKQLLKGGNYEQYVRVNGISVPAVVIFIDNYANFREKTKDAYQDIITTISKEGVGNGIFLVISASGFGSTELPNRIADNIKSVICLEMGDKYKYGDVLKTMRFNILPEQGVRGRGLAKIGGDILEFQTALALKADDDYQRGEKIISACREMRNAWKGSCAAAIPEIPAKPRWRHLAANDEFAELISDREKLPFGYNQADASLAFIKLSEIYSFVITGRNRTGKTNMQKIMMMSAARKNGKIYVISTDGESLPESLAEKLGADYVRGYENIFGFFKEIMPEFALRNRKKNELVGKGFADDELYSEMSAFEPVFIFIDNLCEFAKLVYDPANVSKCDMRGFLENITDKGRNHNIFFISAFNSDDYSLASGYKVFANMTDNAHGAHLGGNLVSQKLFDFTGVSFAEQNRSLKPGIAYLPASDSDNTVKRVVVPLFGGGDV